MRQSAFPADRALPGSPLALAGSCWPSLAHPRLVPCRKAARSALLSNSAFADGGRRQKQQVASIQAVSLSRSLFRLFV